MRFSPRDPVTMTAVVKIRPEKLKEFLDVMPALQEMKLKDKGITVSKWLEDREDPTCFRLTDEWESAEDLRRYCCKESFRVFIGALKTLCVKAEVKYGPLHGKGERGTLASFSC